MKFKPFIITLIIFHSLISNEITNDFTITRLKYGGGGDWYADPSSLPNLLDFIQKETKIKTSSKEIKASIESSNFYNNPSFKIDDGTNERYFGQIKTDILKEITPLEPIVHCV